MTDRGSVAVIGLDGGTFAIFKPWADEGKLPTLKRLMEEGAWGQLESCLPPVTSPAWKCYSTGKNPGRLGIFWWRQVDRRRKKIVGSGSSTLFRCPDLWDYVGQAGFRVASVGMPLTYPPRVLNGYMISGHPYAESSGYTYPPGLEPELEQLLAYRIQPTLAPRADNRLDPEVLEAVKQVVAMRFDAALYLLSKEDLDFLSVVTFDLNMLQHLCWREPPVEELWKLVDAKIGELVEYFDYVFVISDHGLSRIEREFYLNVWLLEQGYLVLNEDSHYPYRLPGLARPLRKLLVKGSEFLGIKETLKRVLPIVIPDWGVAPPGRRQVRHASSFEERIDWDRSRAVATPQGPIYLINYSTEEERVILRDQIAEQLGQIRDPATGNR
ncbi:MAG: alkaline phosphatase family protein, partial [Promethearchaeota archaeon]